MSKASSQADAALLAVDEVAGFWRVADGGQGSCEIALSPLPSGDAFGVSVEKCSLPGLTQARTWRALSAGFELLDAGGTTIVRFDKAGADAFFARKEGYSLERAHLY